MPLRWSIVIISLVIVVSGINTSDAQDAGRLTYVPSPNEIEQYFPGELSANTNDAWAYYSARYLHFMEEKPLSGSDPKASELYRVLVETRPHNTPVVVRLSIGIDGTGEVVTKMGSDPYRGDLRTNRTANVVRANVGEFIRLLSNSDFWSMPVQQPRGNRNLVLGEPSWVFEASKGGTYHVVCRNTSGLASLKDAELFLVTNIGKVDLSSTLGPSADAR